MIIRRAVCAGGDVAAETGSGSFARRVVPVVRGRGKGQEGAIGGIPEQVLAGAIGVLALAGVLALGATLFSDTKTTTEVATISTIFSKTRDAYFTAGSYATGSMNSVLMSKKVFPDRMVASGAPLNSWGGVVTLTGATTTFTLQYDSVPQDACMDLLAKVPTAQVQSISVGGTAVTTFPIIPSVAQTACQTTTSVSIIWTSL